MQNETDRIASLLGQPPEGRPDCRACLDTASCTGRCGCSCHLGADWGDDDAEEREEFDDDEVF